MTQILCLCDIFNHSTHVASGTRISLAKVLQKEQLTQVKPYTMLHYRQPHSRRTLAHSCDSYPKDDTREIIYTFVLGETL